MAMLGRYWGEPENADLNKQLAQITGYTGDFYSGNWGKFEAANPQWAQNRQVIAIDAQKTINYMTAHPEAYQNGQVIPGATAIPLQGVDDGTTTGISLVDSTLASLPSWAKPALLALGALFILKR